MTEGKREGGKDSKEERDYVLRANKLLNDAFEEEKKLMRGVCKLITKQQNAVKVVIA